MSGWTRGWRTSGRYRWRLGLLSRSRWTWASVTYLFFYQSATSSSIEGTIKELDTAIEICVFFADNKLLTLRRAHDTANNLVMLTFHFQTCNNPEPTLSHLVSTNILHLILHSLCLAHSELTVPPHYQRPPYPLPFSRSQKLSAWVENPLPWSTPVQGLTPDS